MEILVAVLIGAIAGWIAGKIMKSKATGAFINILLGITGGYLGKRLLDFFNIETSSSWVGTILTAVIGAILLIYLWRIITKKKK
ncbi:MAG: GlsB/YeaQ/YmgE family stress response membrane protein [Fluviicola sp.]|nr:GlsB/YeaQ/YmgE family stress response membrane protein [Fluviicola sp.]